MLLTKPNNTVDRSEFWWRQLEEFKQYSGSQNQFCRERGFCPHLLHYWRRKLSGEPRGGRQIGLQVGSPFIPVKVERLARSTPTASLPSAKWLAEIILHLHGGGET